MPLPLTVSLLEFVDRVAVHLPGSWTSAYTRPATGEDQHVVALSLWDTTGHIGHVVNNIHQWHDAYLERADGLRLYVVDRPQIRRPQREFLVAAFAPVGFDPRAFDEVEGPRGIAVSNAPVRAASEISRRLIPRYEHALALVRRHHDELADPLPEPPLRRRHVTMLSAPDGSLTALYDYNEEAQRALIAHGFRRDRATGLCVLPPSHGPTDQALRVAAVADQLQPVGISVTVFSAPPTTSPRPHATPAPAARTAVLASPASGPARRR